MESIIPKYVPDFIYMSKIDITNIQLSDIQQMICELPYSLQGVSFTASVI